MQSLVHILDGDGLGDRADGEIEIELQAFGQIEVDAFGGVLEALGADVDDVGAGAQGRRDEEAGGVGGDFGSESGLLVAQGDGHGGDAAAGGIANESTDGAGVYLGKSDSESEERSDEKTHEVVELPLGLNYITAAGETTTGRSDDE